MKTLAIPMELLEGPIWNNGKSEAQAYIQFYKWAVDMGGIPSLYMAIW